MVNIEAKVKNQVEELKIDPETPVDRKDIIEQAGAHNDDDDEAS